MCRLFWWGRERAGRSSVAVLTVNLGTDGGGGRLRLHLGAGLAAVHGPQVGHVCPQAVFGQSAARQRAVLGADRPSVLEPDELGGRVSAAGDTGQRLLLADADHLSLGVAADLRGARRVCRCREGKGQNNN